MLTWEQVQKMFEQVCQDTGLTCVKLITVAEWNRIYSYAKIQDNEMARCCPADWVITTRYSDYDGLELRNSLWHEILHILFYSKPHWWIECAAQKIAGGNRGFYAERYDKNISDVPNRDKLLKLARKSAKRYNHLWEIVNKGKNP